jgi:hypothetical protein
LEVKSFPFIFSQKCYSSPLPHPSNYDQTNLKNFFIATQKKLAQKTHIQSPSRNTPKCQQSFQIQTWDVFTPLWQQLLLDIFCKQNKMSNLKFGNFMIFVDIFGLWNRNKKEINC